MSIASNLAAVRERISAAARRAGRNPDDIALMAVTKTFDADRIREAHAAGLRLFGENRVQEFATKADAVRALEGARWHLIGHLQSNKATRAAELFDAVDTVDSLRLASKLNHAAPQQRGAPLPVLIEINLAGEADKSGVAADSKELEDILYAAPQLEALIISGLMAIPPFTDNPEDSRPCFRRLRQLRDQIAARKLPAVSSAVLSMDALSMGMSHDFEIAIEEGSTCVRLGTALFGERPGTP